jgi:hypothetical protein
VNTTSVVRNGCSVTTFRCIWPEECKPFPFPEAKRGECCANGNKPHTHCFYIFIIFLRASKSLKSACPCYLVRGWNGKGKVRCHVVDIFFLSGNVHGLDHRSEMVDAGSCSSVMMRGTRLRLSFDAGIEVFFSRVIPYEGGGLSLFCYWC